MNDEPTAYTDRMGDCPPMSRNYAPREAWQTCSNCTHPPEAHSWGSTGAGPCRCGRCPEFEPLPSPPQPDYVGAIAAIKELHQRGMWTATEAFYCRHCNDSRGYTKGWPCPTIAALGRYGCD